MIELYTAVSTLSAIKALEKATDDSRCWDINFFTNNCHVKVFTLDKAKMAAYLTTDTPEKVKALLDKADTSLFKTSEYSLDLIDGELETQHLLGWEDTIGEDIMNDYSVALKNDYFVQKTFMSLTNVDKCIWNATTSMIEMTDAQKYFQIAYNTRDHLLKVIAHTDSEALFATDKNTLANEDEIFWINLKTGEYSQRIIFDSRLQEAAETLDAVGRYVKERI